MAIASFIGNPTFCQPAAHEIPVQKGKGIEAASQTWAKNSFVASAIVSGKVEFTKAATDAVLIYGWCPDSAKGTTLNPPDNMLGYEANGAGNAFRAVHYPFDPEDVIFEINIGNATDAHFGTTNGPTWAGGGSGGVALAPGQVYAMYVPATGTYAGIQFLDVTDTTNTIFEIVELAYGALTTDNNTRVRVKVIPGKIQG